MTLNDKIREEMKNAMRAKDKLRVEVLRSLMAAFVNELVSIGKKPDSDIEDILAIKVLKKALKQRKDAAEQFKAGGREDLSEKERKEAEIISEFLPEDMRTDKIEEIVRECMEDTQASSMNDFSKVMPCVMKKVAGMADGSRVKSIVEKMLYT